MAIRERGGTTVLGGTGEKLWLAMCWLTFVVIGAAGVASNTQLGARVFFASFFLVNGVIFLRIIRTQVRAEPEVLVIRGLFRTRRLRWDEVKSAAVVPTNDWGIFGIVEVTDQDGRQIKADGVGNWLPLRDQDLLPASRMTSVINNRARA